MTSIWDTVEFSTETALSTAKLGASLVDTLYGAGKTIHLSGDLGAGKTQLIQGIASGVGITEGVLSPTFAIAMEHNVPRRKTKDERRKQLEGLPFQHFDLYRLSQEEASHILEQYDEPFGLRCIEWAERIEEEGDILVEITQREGDRRDIQIVFRDIPLPSEQEVEDLRKEVRLPEHIASHCDAVKELAIELADLQIERGIVVRREALSRACALHDLLRFIDFTPSGAHVEIEISEDMRSTWENLKGRYDGLGHEEACSAYLSELGYRDLGTIISTHGLGSPPGKESTIEQKLLYYADKRVCMTDHVSVEERFEDFARRYPDNPNRERWYREVKKVEKELLGELEDLEELEELEENNNKKKG